VVLLAVLPGKAQQAGALGALLLNGDFEGPFYIYGSGQVAQSWVPYDLNPTSSPQYLRSTLHKHQGLASQQIWADRAPWYSGILQTTALTSASSVRIQAGKKYTVHVWVYSIYGGADSAVQNDKIRKRVGIHPSGNANPKATDIVWTPWHGQDKVWTQINALVEAKGDRLTIFIEAEDVKSGGQDQFYIDDIWIEEEGALPPTPTPTATAVPTATPVPTPTSAIAVVHTLPVGRQPQGVAVIPSLNRFFVANSGDNTISSLDGFLNWRRTDVVSGGDRPTSVASDPDQCRLYSVNSASNSVTVFNSCSNRQTAVVLLGEGSAPGAVAVLTTTNTIYVANTALNSISLIDGESLAVIKTLAVGPVPGQIATNPLTNRVYLTFRGYPADNAGGIAIIDGNTQLVVKTIGLSYNDQVPAPAPYGVAVNPVTNRVYVATTSGRLVVLDGGTDAVIANLSPPVASGLDAVAVNPRTNNVFVCSATGNVVYVYDADEQQWSTTLSVGAGLFRGIVVNPLTNQLVVSNTGEDSVSVIRDFGAYQPFRAWIPDIRR
jgi:DNA-binding beta-propeller fold protein YncE